MNENETMRDFSKRVNATHEGWDDRKHQRQFNLIAAWVNAAEEMFWANQFGQPVTDEMRQAVVEAGEAVLRA